MPRLIVYCCLLFSAVAGAGTAYVYSLYSLYQARQGSAWTEASKYLPLGKVVVSDNLTGWTRLPNDLPPGSILVLCRYDAREQGWTISIDSNGLPWSFTNYDELMHMNYSANEITTGTDHTTWHSDSERGIAALEIVVPDIAWQETAQAAIDNLTCAPK